MSRRLWLSLQRLLEVHSSGDCGSPRVSGSTSARRSSSKFASVSLTGLRPPPARRTRSKSGVSPARNSASPRPIVLRAIPVARITATIPPCPADVASAAAKRRRPRSSSTGASASKRWRMADSSITPKRYSLAIPEGIPPANKIPPDPIHLFADRPLVCSRAAFWSFTGSSRRPRRPRRTTWSLHAAGAVDLKNEEINMARKKRVIRSTAKFTTLDDFLGEEGKRDEFEAIAVKEVLAWQIGQAMKEKNISRASRGQRMKTSLSQIGRLLDPKDGNVTLATLQRAARMVGRSLRLELV